jgi:Pvc16 N-terminal domain/IPT/TIG domain
VASDTGRQLNLFLYQVTLNRALRSSDLPARNANGDLVQRPVLALNLHYILTAYGQNDDEVDAQHLLAYAMVLAHGAPVLTRDQIRAAIAAQPAVSQSDLADQVELVKLCVQELSLEEIAKLWPAFQSNMRLSVAYEATTVLVERPLATRVAPPVRDANLYVLPIQIPVVDQVTPQVVAPGANLTLQGRNLKGDVVKVRFGTVLAPPASVSDTQVTVTLPAALLAGVNTVQVVQDLLLGNPPTPHRGFESNIAAFILAPQITTPAPISAARNSTLNLAFQPPVARNQRLSLLIGDREVLLPARASGSAPVTSIGFPIPADMQTGSLLLRLRVDGAESPLTVDTNSASSTFNQYVAPTVTIT